MILEGVAHATLSDLFIHGDQLWRDIHSFCLSNDALWVLRCAYAVFAPASRHRRWASLHVRIVDLELYHETMSKSEPNGVKDLV